MSLQPLKLQGILLVLSRFTIDVLGSCARNLRACLLFIGLAASLALAGCAGTRGGPIPYNVENFKAPDEPTVLTLEKDYKIAGGDTLQVDVFQVPDLSGERTVNLTGQINMPLIGSIDVAGLTTAQLDQLLTQRLSAKYLQNPDVAVGVKSSARRNITLAGSVRQPGLYPVNGPLTLVQAVALARGFGDDANPRQVAIVRTIDGKRQGAAFDLVSIQRGQMDDPEVYSGDLIIVNGSSVRAWQREILTALPILGFFRPF
jgi:polysaccharide export outer membrane protein